MTYLLALLSGVVAGSRSMMAPALICWAAHLGWLDLSETWMSFLASPWAVGIATLLAAAELVADQLPSTPARTIPASFAARLVSGGLAGAAIASDGGSMAGGLLAGLVGAVIGTFGGLALRRRLAAEFGKDPPAAFLEDALAIGGAVLIGVALR
jgi:uncharacterized membrane protein